MIEMFHSSEKSPFTKITTLQKGCWINMLAPTEDELQEISRMLEIDLDFLKDPLDSEERSRIEYEENQILLIVDIPIVEFGDDKEKTDISFTTYPLGMILLPEYFITICLKETPILEEFRTNRIKNCHTASKNRFLLHLLLKSANYYMRYLKHINRKTEESEVKLHRSTKNQELFELLNLEKSLVYFTTSLRSNQNVLNRLNRSKQIKWSDDDDELLEDVVVEFDQALEMTQTYSGILSSLTAAFASVISNNLNMVMKLLTSITIVLAIPTMVSSFFGMNVRLPFADHPFAFGFIIVATFMLVISSVIFLYRKDLF